MYDLGVCNGQGFHTHDAQRLQWCNVAAEYYGDDVNVHLTCTRSRSWVRVEMVKKKRGIVDRIVGTSFLIVVRKISITLLSPPLYDE